jgi:protein SCO1/2
MLALLVIGVAAWQIVEARPARFHGTVPDETLPAADFALTDHTGEPVTLRSYRGRPVLLFFGYTRCPDVCPLTLARLARATQGMGDGDRGLRILMVSVDPEHDTPERLAEYASHFGPHVRGLTGSPEALERARAAYGIHVAPAGHAGHGGGQGRIGHTPAVFGIDRAGRLRVLTDAEADEAQLRADARALTRA